MIIRKTFKAEVAHRLVNSYSKKCQSIHGHSYIIEVFLEGDELDDTGMLMDFGELKDKAGEFIDAFDHSMLLWRNDPIVTDMVRIMDSHCMRYIIVGYNPTAENMALHILKYLVEDLDLQLVHSVTVHETATGKATATRSDGRYMDIDSRTLFSTEIGYISGCDDELANSLWELTERPKCLGVPTTLNGADA